MQIIVCCVVFLSCQKVKDIASVMCRNWRAWLVAFSFAGDFVCVCVCVYVWLCVCRRVCWTSNINFLYIHVHWHKLINPLSVSSASDRAHARGVRFCLVHSQFSFSPLFSPDSGSSAAFFFFLGVILYTLTHLHTRFCSQWASGAKSPSGRDWRANGCDRISTGWALYVFSFCLC